MIPEKTDHDADADVVPAQQIEPKPQQRLDPVRAGRFLLAVLEWAEAEEAKHDEP